MDTDVYQGRPSVVLGVQCKEEEEKTLEKVASSVSGQENPIRNWGVSAAAYPGVEWFPPPPLHCYRCQKFSKFGKAKKCNDNAANGTRRRRQILTFIPKQYFKHWAT